MKSKKKGFTLMIVIVVLCVITIVCTAIMGLSYASYKSTIQVEKKTKLKLKAESGIEKEFYYLKLYFGENGNVLEDPVNNFDANSVTLVNDSGATDGIECKTEIYATNDPIHPTVDLANDKANPKYFNDKAATGRSSIPYIRVISTANYVGKSGSVTVTCDIDKNSFENSYFDRIFHYSNFTTAPTSLTSIDSSFNNAAGANLSVTGSMYLQGNLNVLNPFTINDTNSTDKTELLVKVTDNAGIVLNNNNNINGPIQDTAGKAISLRYDCTTPGSNYGTNWSKRNMDYLPVNNLIEFNATDHPGAKPIQNMDTISDDVNNSYITMSNTASGDPKCVEYKVHRNIASPSPLIFQELVNGKSSSNGIYSKIVGTIGAKPAPGDSTLPAWQTKFSNCFKILLVDGNLTINSDTSYNYDKYIIYCTGTVTFKGEAHFFDSSIFANKIDIQGGPVEFDGVNTQASINHKVGGGSTIILNQFTPEDKKIFNSYFIQNVNGYGAYLHFNVLSWKEN